MAVGMVAEQPVAEPQHPVKTEVLPQPRLDVGLGQVRIAVRVEQALLGGDDEAGAVGVDRPALEDPVHQVARQPRSLDHRRADLLVAFHLVLAAPAVEAEAPGKPLAGIV